MVELTAKRKVQDIVKERIDRDNFDELAEAIFSSYKSVDWTNDHLKELRPRLERDASTEARDLQEQAGILCVALGDFQAAVEHLLPVKTRKESAHFLGRAYNELGLQEEALAMLEAGRHGEDGFSTDMLIAEIHCARRDAEAARKLCERYGKSQAESPDWLYLMGRVLETEGAYEEAMAHYEQAIERNPDHRQGLFRLAMNCDLNGDDDRAVSLYERCAGLKPTSVGALINLGVLYEDGGNYEGAMECYKRVLAIDPAHGRAKLYLKDAESSLRMRTDAEKTQCQRDRHEVLLLPLSNFELSARCRNALDKLNVRTLGDLTRITEGQLLQFKNFGETSLDEIRVLLGCNDLQFAGSRPPARISSRATDIFVDQDEENEGGDEEEEVEQEEGEDEKSSDMSVDELGLSTRSRKCMDRLGVSTMGELTRLSEDDLLAAPNFGRTSVAEIKTKLTALGLSLSETPEEAND